EVLEDWEVVAARAAAVPHALDPVIAALREGMSEGLVAARRQAVAVARQADTWGGRDGGTKPYFLELVDDLEASGVTTPALRTRLEQVGQRATAAYAAMGRFLVDEYLPVASEKDAVGEARYRRWARVFLGSDTLDLLDTYAWGWEELARIE